MLSENSDTAEKLSKYFIYFSEPTDVNTTSSSLTASRCPLLDEAYNP